MRARELCLIFATSLFLFGCSEAKEPLPKNQETRYVDRKEYLAEFERVKNRLTLPAGSSWETEATAAPAGNVRFARGVGTTDAELHWFCEWEKAWLTAHTLDSTNTKVAMDQLENIFNLQVYLVALDDGGRARTREIIQEAQRGDPSGLQADVDVNCPN